MPSAPQENSITPDQESDIPIWIVLDLRTNKKGSFEDQLLALADRLTRTPYRVTFVFDCEVPGWLGAALAARRVQVRTLHFRHPRRCALAFLNWLLAEPPALVHFHFVRAYSPLVLAARAVGARVILHDHMTLGQALVPTPARGPIAARLARLAKQARGFLMNPLVDLRVAVSGFVADSVVAAEFAKKDHVAVVENGIDVSRFVSADSSGLRGELGLPDGPIIVCGSRLAPEKGVDVLIEAFARIEDRAAVLLLVGGGSDSDKCRALVERLGLGERVRFLGMRDDMHRLLHSATVVVVPTLCDEAFGLVVVEAMACGKPVIVTAAGAMPEIVDSGRCGLVVPKRDAPALARAIDSLLANPAMAAQLGDNARRRVLERYHIDKWLDNVCSIYQRFLPRIALQAPAPPSPPSPARPTPAPRSAPTPPPASLA
jgi:glycosyltransferase involved in cell wall biosynthesis